MTLLLLYERLLGHYGPQHWWPAESPFEMMVGAVLVQSTAWGGVEKAIAALDSAGCLAPAAMLHAGPARIEPLVRPAGFFRVKTRRLLALARFVEDAGGPSALAALPTGTLRARLLGVHGIGAETADAILVYAFGRAAFIADAYARRLLARLGMLAADASLADLHRLGSAALPGSPGLANELHALIVAHGKAHCRATPLCARCPLIDGCALGSSGRPHRPLARPVQGGSPAGSRRRRRNIE